MPSEKRKTRFLKLLEASLAGHGWPGRMFGARQWLLDGAVAASADAAALSVIAIRRNSSPGMRCEAFPALREEGLPFQGILVDVPSAAEETITADAAGNAADAHLVLSTGAPWYTAFNLGAACADGTLLIFLNGTARPQAGLLAAYAAVFATHPETVAARGALHFPELDACASQVTGSFLLQDGTAFWPVDLDENMAMRAEPFFALGGFDESLIGGYGALDLSIRLFGRNPDICSQRHVPQAAMRVLSPHGLGLPMEEYLIQRQRSWLQLNDACKRYLELYGTFWQEQARGARHA